MALPDRGCAATCLRTTARNGMERRCLTPRLLLIADQGFGDSIQFCRYIPWACARCPHVVVVADPVLHPLIRQTHPALELVGHWDRCPPFAAYCPLSGLPRLHGTTLDTIPARSPISTLIQREPRPGAPACRTCFNPATRRIGIVWAGRPTHNNDLNRSMSLSAFAPMAALDGISLVSLQKGPTQSAIADYFDRAPLLNLGAEIADFVDTMAIIETLDLVVTVDTSVAHLAAAMGKPVWILLPYAPDWRWLLERATAPGIRPRACSVSRARAIGTVSARRVGEALSEPRFQRANSMKNRATGLPCAPLDRGGRSALDRASRAKLRMRIMIENIGARWRVKYSSWDCREPARRRLRRRLPPIERRPFQCGRCPSRDQQGFGICCRRSHRASAPHGLAVRSSRQDRRLRHRRLHLPHGGSPCRLRSGRKLVHRLGGPCAAKPVQGHRPDFRRARAIRFACHRRGVRPSTGRRKSQSVCGQSSTPNGRPRCSWDATSLSTTATAPDRRGAAAGRPGLHRGPRYGRNRRQKSLDFEYVRARIEPRFASSRGASSWFRFPISRMSSTAATSATPWRGSTLIFLAGDLRVGFAPPPVPPRRARVRKRDRVRPLAEAFWLGRQPVSDIANRGSPLVMPIDWVGWGVQEPRFGLAAHVSLCRSLCEPYDWRGGTMRSPPRSGCSGGRYRNR